ncbi:MAG TPA: hypothetical protein VIS49_12495 [Cyclobacteriaceae bacterium]
MKIKLAHILTLCIAGCITLLPQKSYAQDGLPPQYFQEPSNQELNLDEDKALLYEQNEGRQTRSIQNFQRDSVATTTSRPKEAKKSNADKKEGDALSFNFLYYIIQKYKISDIVDQ